MTVLTHNLGPLKGKVSREVEQALSDLHDRITGVALDVGNVKKQMVLLPTAAQIQAHTATVGKAASAIANFDTSIAGVSTAHKGQSSVLPTVSGSFAYTANGNSITWYWDGTNGSTLLTILWPDGSTTPVPPSSQIIQLLSPTTTYRFYPYFDTVYGGVVFAVASGGIGLPAAAYSGTNLGAALLTSADGHVTMSTGIMTGATTSGGAGGGSGGGSGGRNFF